MPDSYRHAQNLVTDTDRQGIMCLSRLIFHILTGRINATTPAEVMEKRGIGQVISRGDCIRWGSRACGFYYVLLMMEVKGNGFGTREMAQ